MVPESDVDTIEIPAPNARDSRPTTISSRVQADLGALSHQGHIRKNNEDHFLVARFDRCMQTLLTNVSHEFVPERSVETAYGMLVADGMGGAVAGEVASRIAISQIMDLVLRTPDWLMRLDDARLQEVLNRMDQRFRQVNATVHERAQSDPTLSGMGTTLTLAATLGVDCAIVHVGDSRAYLFRRGQLQRLTSDHTVAESLAELGIIRGDEVAKHPMRHMLTNAIGADAERVRVEIHQLTLEDGDQVLLCTDGLTEMVPEAQIKEVLSRSGSSMEIAKYLVELALEAGGKDNVTVVLSRYLIPPESSGEAGA